MKTARTNEGTAPGHDAAAAGKPGTDPTGELASADAAPCPGGIGRWVMTDPTVVWFVGACSNLLLRTRLCLLCGLLVVVAVVVAQLGLTIASVYYMRCAARMLERSLRIQVSAMSRL